MANIGFIGLGNMGGPMAANLVKSGEHVRGFDVVPASRETSARDGVQIVANARSCVENADIVISMLPAGEHVLSVWNDVLPAANQGALFIDCSTIDVGSARKAHGLAAERGIATLDAPVSGGVCGACRALADCGGCGAWYACGPGWGGGVRVFGGPSGVRRRAGPCRAI